MDVNGQPLDPGPGVAPDVAVAPEGNLPSWWATVAEGGTDLAIADARAEGAPAMTGTEFLERALELQPDAKRVLLTAYADTDAAQIGRRLEALALG